MSYRCEICAAPAPPKQPRLTYRLTRRGRLGHVETARELAVCRGCHALLREGHPLAELQARYRQDRAARESREVEVRLPPVPPPPARPPDRVVPLGQPSQPAPVSAPAAAAPPVPDRPVPPARPQPGGARTLADLIAAARRGGPKPS